MNTLIVVLVIALVGLVGFRAWWWSDTEIAKRVVRKLKASK